MATISRDIVTDIMLVKSRAKIGTLMGLYRQELDSLIDRAQAGKISQGEFANSHRDAISEFGPRAFDAGLVDGGVDPAERDEDDNAYVTSWIEGQAYYTDGFAFAVFDAIDDQDKIDAVKSRLVAWIKSLESDYNAGLASASKNKTVTWNIGNTEKHCKTCSGLDGKKHRMKWFSKRGYIPRDVGSDVLECRGFNCDCYFEDSDGNRFL